jgi:hypothetical protein
MAIKTPNPNLDIKKNPGQTMSPKVPKLNIKMPKQQDTVQTGMAPESKKDPVKQAEQLKNKDNKKEALKEAVSMNKHGQWSLNTSPLRKSDDALKEALVKSLDEEMEKIDWKGVGKKVAGAATAASIAAGAMGGGATEAKADIGHVKHYLKSMHGQVFNGHKLHITHNDTSRKELKGTKTGSGTFTIHVGDYHIKGKYAATGDGNYNKLQLAKPTHVKDGHQPFEGDVDTNGDEMAEALHDHLTDGEHGLHNLLTSKNRGVGNKTGLDIGSFNTNDKNQIKKHDTGQWSLEKKKPSFNPRAEQESDAGELRDQWVNFDNEEARNKIPRMEGAARVRSMSKLAGTTDYRRNPETNEVEFLMHRGMSTGELDTNHNQEGGHTNYRPGTINGWTPNKSVAHDFGVYGHDGEPGYVASAWVPESQLHSSMRQYGGKNKITQSMTRDEDEWLIDHSAPMNHHEVIPADKTMIDRKNK